MEIIITVAAVAVLAGFALLVRLYMRARRDAREAYALASLLEGANKRLGSALFGKGVLEAAIRRAKTIGRN
jgi:Flp pilus assembly protein TadB